MTVATKLKEDILESLSLGPKSLPTLVNTIAAHHHISVQAVYKMFRLLRAQEIITVHNKEVSLSLIWVAEQKEKYAFVERSYKGTAYIKSLIEKKVTHITFTFKSLNELELFWTHIYTLVAQGVDSSFPSYAIQPHDWYLYARPITSDYWETQHNQTRRLSRFVVTHTTALDKAVFKKRKERQGRLIEFVFNHNPLKQESNIYYNLLNDFIFKATFDKKVTQKLDSFIEHHTALPLSKEAQTDLAIILAEKGKFTLTIYKSPTKALAIEKKVKKFFE